tara:strand:- start:1461 stop:2168 length:708 start_codon:yes stop_codon:yes gene_type:complete
MHPNVKKWLEFEYAPQKSQEWLDLRMGMLTASDAASAIGVNKYETPYQLLLRKCGKGPVFTGNEATRHGEKYEDEARIIYEERHNEVVHELGLCPHPNYSFLGGSPDGVSESGKLIEIKCPMMRSIDGTVPEHYMPQLQLCMDILDLEEADFIQYKPEELTWPKPSEFVVTNVKRDREWFAKYMPVMRDFWDKVVYHREHGIEDPPPKKPRKKKEIIRPECTIVTDSDEDYYDEY